MIQNMIFQYVNNEILYSAVTLSDINSLIAYLLLEIGFKYKIVAIIVLIL
jgi:hypothetical protein